MHCKFCKGDVNTKNFARHLERKHDNEAEIQQIFCLEKNSKARKTALAILRNDTNFDLYIRNNELRTLRNRDVVTEFEYYPCAYCKALVLKTYLTRHVKTCPMKRRWLDTKTDTTTKTNHASNSQTEIVCARDPTNVISKLNIKSKVSNFENMLSK